MNPQESFVFNPANRVEYYLFAVLPSKIADFNRRWGTNYSIDDPITAVSNDFAKATLSFMGDTNGVQSVWTIW